MKREINESKNLKIVKFITAILLIIATILILKTFNPKNVRETILSRGKWSIIVYILLWTILPIGFFPVPVLAISGGLGFGFVMGSLLTLIGASFNMAIMFLLSRFIFRDAAEKFVSKYEKGKKILEIPEEKLTMGIFIARVLPLIPYNLINYACGLTKVSFIGYTVSSVLGILPGTLVYINMGNKAIDPSSPDFFLSIIYFILLSVITTILAFFYVKRSTKESKND